MTTTNEQMSYKEAGGTIIALNLFIINDYLADKDNQSLEDRRLRITDGGSHVYELTRNFLNEPCYRDGNAIMVLSEKKNGFRLTGESEKLLNGYLKEKERRQMAVVEPVRLNIFKSYMDVMSLSADKPKVNEHTVVTVDDIVPDKIDQGRKISLKNIFDELDYYEGKFSVTSQKGLRLRIEAEFPSINKAEKTWKKLVSKWKLSSYNATIDLGNRKKIIINDVFSQDEIDVARKVYKF